MIIINRLLNYKHIGMVCFKGDPVAQAQEQAQANFDNELTTLFQAQYGKQSQITQYLTNQMEPQITAGGIGFPGNALAAARTQATDTLSTQFQNAEKQAASSENQSGLPSGVNAQITGSLASQEAQAQSGAQTSITMANEAQRQQNYWNSINVLNGQAATENPLGYASAATAGSNSVANLSQAVTASNQSQLLGALGGIVGGIGGGLVTGGMKNLGAGTGFFGCWVASKLFGGWFDQRTVDVRNYIFGKFSQTWYGSALANFYAKHGKWISEKKILVWMLRPLFNQVLVLAQGQ